VGETVFFLLTVYSGADKQPFSGGEKCNRSKLDSKLCEENDVNMVMEEVMQGGQVHFDWL
jgi:hypothetical protein